jgi:ATP-dependent helicase/nuclease subunit B
MKQGKFVPVAFELPFGRGENGLPALRIRLEDGRELLLAGQIDRVDMAESADGETAYLRVVDYKTGNNRLKIPDVEAGLQLQLLAYLQVVMDNAAAFTARDARPAGVYYAHVHDETVLSDDPDGSGPGMKLRGVTVPSEEVARLSDPGVNGWSKLVNIYCNDKGALNTGLAEGQMQELRQRVIYMLKDSAAAMLEGLVAVSPLADDDRDACAFCDFASVCGFDRSAAKARSRHDALPGREAETDD